MQYRLFLNILGKRFNRRSFGSPFKADSDEGELEIMII